MNPRESSLLNAAAVLLARHGIDASYGPAHAVRDALALETEVIQQSETQERVRFNRAHGYPEVEPSEAQAGGAF